MCSTHVLDRSWAGNVAPRAWYRMLRLTAPKSSWQTVAQADLWTSLCNDSLPWLQEISGRALPPQNSSLTHSQSPPLSLSPTTSSFLCQVSTAVNAWQSDPAAWIPLSSYYPCLVSSMKRLHTRKTTALGSVRRLLNKQQCRHLHQPVDLCTIRWQIKSFHIVTASWHCLHRS